MCVLNFSANFPETFLILRRAERDMTKKYIGFHVSRNCTSQILMKLEFPR